MPIEPIETARLMLVSLAPAHWLALIDGERQFAESFGLPAAEGLRAFLISADVSPAWLASLRASEEADPWRHGFVIVHRGSRSVVGSVGFKGPPDDAAMVEIGYGVLPAFQGQGLATEAAEAAVAWAAESGAVRTVRAHTLPTPNASTRVLAKCGFSRTGDFHDPEDGLVWRWELRVGIGD